MWYKHNYAEPIRSSGKYKLLGPYAVADKGMRHELKIVDLNGSDFVNYTFVASNIYGESRMQIQLLPEGIRQFYSNF